MATSNSKTGGNDEDFTYFIAIDFGTSGSGIAVWAKNYHEGTKVFTDARWVPGQKGVAVKCPTALLLDPDGKFEAFGLKAIKSYHSKQGLGNPSKSEEYYFFNRFKMCLYDEKYLSQDMKIKAANGKELPAHEVISKSFKEMKSLILESLNETLGHAVDKILWIVTVPAIWSPGAKQIMREAATKAGLVVDESSSLILVLEPEAAAMYCQQEILEASRDTSNEKDNCELISHYLVVDCGGGTVDIAAHKLTRKSDGQVSIEEIHQAHGGPHGGFMVNNEFEKLLRNLFQLTKEGFDALKQKFARIWINLIDKEFEESKCQCDSKSPTPITITLPGKLVTYVEEKTGKTMTELVNEYTSHKVEWDDDDGGLVLPFSTVNNLFLPVISQIITAIKQVLRKPECRCVEKILLVGGFAESSILFEEVQKELPALTVKRSSSPQLSVLKGAIIYGRNQNMIKSRKMCQSIGIETWDDFDSSIHDEKRKVVSDDGKIFCRNIFTKFVEINESVDVEQYLDYRFPLTSKNQDSCSIRIIGSHHNKAFYTDEEGCYEVGVITITDLPKYESGKTQVQVALNVSGTEVTVSAYCDGQTQQLPASLNCIKDKYTQKNNDI